MGYAYNYYMELKFKTAADKTAAIAAVIAASRELDGKATTDGIAIDMRELAGRMQSDQIDPCDVEVGWEEDRRVFTFLVPAMLAVQPWRPRGSVIVQGEERDDETDLVCRDGALVFRTYKRIVYRRLAVAGPLPPGTELRRTVGEDRRLAEAFDDDLAGAKDLCLALQRRADEAYAARRRARMERRARSTRHVLPARRKAQERARDGAPSPPEVTL